jgi:hypothetical protein
MRKQGEYKGGKCPRADGVMLPLSRDDVPTPDLDRSGIAYRAHDTSDIAFAGDVATQKSDRAPEHLVSCWSPGRMRSCARASHAAGKESNRPARGVATCTAPGVVSARAEGPCWLEV